MTQRYVSLYRRSAIYGQLYRVYSVTPQTNGLPVWAYRAIRLIEERPGASTRTSGGSFDGRLLARYHSRPDGVTRNKGHQRHILNIVELQPASNIGYTLREKLKPLAIQGFLIFDFQGDLPRLAIQALFEISKQPNVFRFPPVLPLGKRLPPRSCTSRSADASCVSHIQETFQSHRA